MLLVLTENPQAKNSQFLTPKFLKLTMILEFLYTFDKLGSQNKLIYETL